jgi:hypothetical protein
LDVFPVKLFILHQEQGKNTLLLSFIQAISHLFDAVKLGFPQAGVALLALLDLHGQCYISKVRYILNFLFINNGIKQ